MAIIKRPKKDGSVSYQVRVQDSDGSWFKTPFFETEEEAQEFEAKLKKKKRKGAFAASRDAKIYSVIDYWEVWSIENRSDVSDGWKISQNQMFRDYVQPVIGDLKLIQLDIPAIGRVMNLAEKAGLSAQTRKHIYSLMRRMFGDAVEYYRMLEECPVKAKFHRPKVLETKANFLKPNEVWQLLEFVKDHYAGPAIWLEALAGLRSEAMIALKWDSVMFDHDQILIRRAWKQKTGELKEYPKGGNWEYVPIIQQLKDYLIALWNQRTDSQDDFVCQGPRGGRLSYDTYIEIEKKLCEQAGVPVVTPHELRHSCSEVWAQAGAGPEDLRRLLNHKNVSTTMKYIHRTDTRLTAIGQAIGKTQLRVIPGMRVESSQKISQTGKKGRNGKSKEVS